MFKTTPKRKTFDFRLPSVAQMFYTDHRRLQRRLSIQSIKTVDVPFRFRKQKDPKGHGIPTHRIFLYSPLSVKYDLKCYIISHSHASYNTSRKAWPSGTSKAFRIVEASSLVMPSNRINWLAISSAASLKAFVRSKRKTATYLEFAIVQIRDGTQSRAQHYFSSQGRVGDSYFQHLLLSNPGVQCSRSMSLHFSPCIYCD